MSSRISRWYLSSLAMAASRASSRRAICSRWRRSGGRVNNTRQPFSTRAKPSAAARWLLPPPGGPNNSKLAPLFTHASPAASAMTWALLTTGTALEVEAVEGLAGRQPGFGEVAFEPASTALGNLVFGQCGQETSGRPAFLVGLSRERRPHQLYGREPQLGEKQLDTSSVAGIGRSHAAPASWTVLSSL